MLNTKGKVSGEEYFKRCKLLKRVGVRSLKEATTASAKCICNTRGTQ